MHANWSVCIKVMYICIADWWGKMRIALAVYQLARLRSAVVGESYAKLSTACPWKASRDGPCARRSLGRSSQRSTYSGSLQCRDRSNGNIHHVGHMHIAPRRCRYGRYQGHGGKNSITTGLLNTNAGPIRILSFSTDWVCSFTLNATVGGPFGVRRSRRRIRLEHSNLSDKTSISEMCAHVI